MREGAAEGLAVVSGKKAKDVMPVRYSPFPDALWILSGCTPDLV